jgi:hypothetical protein
MPSSYITDETGAESVVIKMLGSGRSATGYNVDGVARHHKMTATCGIKLKNHA